MFGMRIYSLGFNTFWCWRENRGLFIQIGWWNDPSLKWMVAIGPFNIWRYRIIKEMTEEQKWLHDCQLEEALKRKPFVGSK